jgi:SAM-dependent methyltransferase
VLAEHLVNRAGADATLEVQVAAFEDAALPEHAFDVGIAATSFHWVAPDRGLAKVARVLRPGGWWAMWWNVFGDPATPDPFHVATESLMAPLLHSPSVGAQGVPFALDRDARLADLVGAGLVDATDARTVQLLTMTADQIRGLYGTFSPVSRLESGARNALLDAVAEIAARDFGGQVELHLVTAMYLARTPAETDAVTISGPD